MYERWVDATHLSTRDDGDPWAVDYTAHPLLDPTFTQRPSRVGRFFHEMSRRIEHDDEAYRDEINRLLNPPGTPTGAGHGAADLMRSMTEADAYLRDLVALLPAPSQAHVRPQATVTACNDLRTLMSLLFSLEDPRIRFESQRKLYLAKLLLDIDHSRHIQKGPRHKAYIERLLREGLWKRTVDTNTVEIGFELGPDGETIRYNLRPQPGQERWQFRSLFLEREAAGRHVSLDVLYYNCRFKRTVTPISYEIVDGSHRVIERRRWDAKDHDSSGSILSKMIRKGINDPDAITDLLGAMFIVHDEDAVFELLTLLNDVLGNPVSWRNITDTIGFTGDRRRLNRHSGQGYKVYKGDLDVLHPNDEPGLPPYRFPVEIQIYTLEGFLRTVHGAHDANHLALKLRQFLHGLVPYAFPRAVYGDQWLHLGGPNGHGPGTTGL